MTMYLLNFCYFLLIFLGDLVCLGFFARPFLYCSRILFFNGLCTEFALSTLLIRAAAVLLMATAQNVSLFVQIIYLIASFLLVYLLRPFMHMTFFFKFFITFILILANSFFIDHLFNWHSFMCAWTFWQFFDNLLVVYSIIYTVNRKVG